MSYRRKDRFPACFAFYTRFFPTMHVHVEHCDWLNSMKATSSSHFDYLSAGRSQLATFLRDRTTEMVSISLSSSYLARCPCPSLDIDRPSLGINASPPWVFLAISYLGWGCKVGCAPVSFVVLLSVQLKPAY